jgi:hypothetical protein
MADEVSRNQVLESLDKIKEAVISNPNLASEHIFHGMNYFAEMMLASDSNETTNIRKGVDALMTGGSLTSPDYRSSALSKIVRPINPEINTDDISLDGAYYNVKDYIRSLDAKNREISQIVGPVGYIDKMESDPTLGPFPPYLPVGIPIPKNSIIPIITYLTEAVKLMVTVGPLKSDFLRKILSLSLAVFDVLNGEWKNGVLSLLGVLGETPLIIGVIGRLLNQVWNFVAPDLQNDLQDNLYSASKSIFSGFWLTMVTTFAPDKVREVIERVLDKVKPLAERYNKRVDQIEPISKRAAAKMGLDINFPRIPLEEVPSADDLVNLLTIMRNKEVMCNPDVWAVIQPITKEVTLRLLLELFLIPTSEKKRAEMCEGVNTDFQKAVQDASRPVISPLPQLLPPDRV